MNKFLISVLMTALLLVSFGCQNPNSDSAKTYKLTYSSNGAESGTVPVDSSEYSEGSTVKTLGNTGALVKAGFSFTGWNTGADGKGTAYASGATFSMPANAVTLYAMWTHTYSVSYDGNGSTGGAVPASANYTEGASVTVLGNTGSLAKTAYYFNGWNTAADGSGTAYTAGATFTMLANAFTLYAQWTLLPTYTIAYTAPDATGGTIPTDGTRYLAGGSAVVLAGVPTKTDYLLNGWTLSSDGSGTVYKAGDYVTFGDANITLTAKFLPKHMTFDCYHGEAIHWNEAPSASALCFTFVSYGTTTGKFVLTTVDGVAYTGSYTNTGAIARTPPSTGMKSDDTRYTLAFDRGYTATVHLYKTIVIGTISASYQLSGAPIGTTSYGLYTYDTIYASGTETTFNTDLKTLFGTTYNYFVPRNVVTY